MLPFQRTHAHAHTHTRDCCTQLKAPTKVTFFARLAFKRDWYSFRKRHVRNSCFSAGLRLHAVTPTVPRAYSTSLGGSHVLRSRGLFKSCLSFKTGMDVDLKSSWLVLQVLQNPVIFPRIKGLQLPATHFQHPEGQPPWRAYQAALLPSTHLATCEVQDGSCSKFAPGVLSIYRESPLNSGLGCGAFGPHVNWSTRHS